MLVRRSVRESRGVQQLRKRDFVPPMATFFTVRDDFQFQEPSCAGIDYTCWPTIAPSSLDYYPADGEIREFKNSLLITSLKQGGGFRARLSRDGRSVVALALHQDHQSLS
jgi:hypothetical protein